VRNLLIALFLLTAMPGKLVAQQTDNKKLLKKILTFKDADSARRYSDSLLTLARRDNNKTFEAKILYRVAFKYYALGKEQTALEYARKAFAAISPTDDSTTYVKSRLLVAYMLSRGGQNEPAFKEAFATLKLTDKYNWRKLRIETKICIADIYRPVREIDRALPFAQQAIDEAKAVKDTGLYIFAMSTLSNVLSGPKKHGDIPVANTTKAAQILETLLSTPYKEHIATFDRTNYLGNLGRLYEMLKQYDKAEATLLTAIDTAYKYDYLVLAKHSLNELATLNLDRKDYKKAILYGNKALTIQPGNQANRVTQRNIYNKLEDAYANIGDYKKAYEFAVKENALNDTILTTDQSRFTAELDEKYRNDKRLLLAANRNSLLQQQRNLTIIAAIFILVVLVITYLWLADKKRKQAAALEREHAQLARLDEMKTRFFANVSHELKTPLTLIMGPAEQLAQNADLPEQHRASAKTIVRNSKKLLDMVNELLDLGKLETGNLQVKAGQVQLAPFIRLLYKGFASAAAYKQLTYTLTCTINENLHVALDRDKFEKVANNFISNAIKYTPAGRAVNVKAAIENGMIILSVEDNGNGIHPADERQIFDRYYQGSQNQTNADGGTGIGLSIAKELAEAMGGTVTLHTTFGEGSRFTARIPLVEVTAEHITLKTDADTGDITQLSHNTAVTVTSNKKILVVEDHDEMVGYITSVLSADCTVITAGNGMQALQLLSDGGKNSLPDLIISDVMMPEMDGFTLLQKLKEHPVWCSIPVIMLTALTDNHNKLKALNIGVDDYLTKPFVAGELVARVNNLLANAGNRTNLSDSGPALEHDTEEDANHTAMPPSPADLAWISKLETVVRRHIGKSEINLHILSDEMAISERQLNRRIKQITGLTPNKYVRTIRLQIAREAIESGKYRTVAEISYLAGFETPAYFSKLFKEHYGRDVNDIL